MSEETKPAVLDPDVLHASMLAYLQSAFDADPAAMHAMICNRVPCRAALADHPHVIVDANRVLPGTFHVGMLGLINGFLALHSAIPVAAQFEHIDDVPVTVGFTTYKLPSPPIEETKEASSDAD